MNSTLTTDSPSELAPLRRHAGLDSHALQEWLTSPKGPRLPNVRSRAEFQTAHIPGSYNVPLDLLREHRTELRTHLGDEVVLVCRSGARAGRAESLLGAIGLDNLRQGR